MAGADGGAADPWRVPVQWDRTPPADIDEGEVRRALGLMLADSGHVMIQTLPGANWRYLHVADTDGIIAAVRGLPQGHGIYFTLNPISAPGDRAVYNTDIACRRWLLVDVDAVKPMKNASTTDEEKEQSGAVATAVRDYLRAEGWPEPIHVDSGNNWQLLYRIDLPNNEFGRQLVAKSLKALAGRFNTPHVVIDPAVHDARRICKLPGTWVRKGPNMPDRPWRLARIMSVPHDLRTVPGDLLQRLAGLAPAPPAREPAGESDRDAPEYDPAAAVAALARDVADDPWLVRWSQRANQARWEKYAQGALRKACATVASCTQNRNTLLHKECVGIGSLCAAGHLNEGQARLLLTLAGKASGLGQDGDPREIERAVDNGFGWGLRHPRLLTELASGRLTPDSGPAPAPALDPAPAAPRAAAETPTEAPPGPAVPIIIWAHTIQPKKVQWLWPGRIPAGKMTTFAGQTSIGKTFCLCDIAARISTGAEWPFTGGECARPGKTLIISAEDDMDDTLVPRLMQLNADLSKIAFLHPEVEGHFTMSALELLSAAIGQMGEDVKLVVIDPPTSYMAGVDDHKNAELRGVLTPIKRWCTDTGVAMIMNTHVNKGGQGVEALSRVMGSAAWVQAVRTAYMFAPDPDDASGERVLFTNLKINIGRKPKSLAYRIDPAEDDPELATLSWLSEEDTTADEALSKPKAPRKPLRSEAAVGWVTERFREQRDWSCNDLVRLAKEAGISRNALYEPAVMGLPIHKERPHDGVKHWTWHALEGWPPPEEPTPDLEPGRGAVALPPWGEDGARDQDPFGRAIQFLTILLVDGPVERDRVVALGAERGILFADLERARQTLGVRDEVRGDREYWSLR